MEHRFISKAENEELIRKIKSEISILEYAKQRGYEVVRGSGKYYSLKEHDSVMIDPYKNCFWRNSQPGVCGSIVDFAMHFHNYFGKGAASDPITQHEALTILTEMIHGHMYYYVPPPPKQKEETNSAEKKSLILPERDQKISNVYAYLVHTRKLSPAIVSSLISKKIIYQDKRKNCVFVGYNQNKKPVWYACRGTNSEKRFFYEDSANDYTYGAYINNDSNVLLVSESFISGLSLCTIMEKKGKSMDQYNHLFLGGVKKLDPLIYHVQNHHFEKIVLAFDHDEAGLSAIDKAVKQLEQQGFKGEIIPFYPVEPGYDWNDVLKNQIEKNLDRTEKMKDMDR